ncbi:hypothetical protein JCM3775_004139 [Rhodotorula graminis]
MSNTTGTSSQSVGADAGQRGKNFASPDLPTSSSSSTSSSSFAPPPRHPPAPTTLPFSQPSQTPTTTATAAHTSSPASSAGASLGGRVRGVFEAIHGAGEALRGNINAAVDGLGDGIANRPQGSVESRQSQSAASGEQQSVAQKGLDELKSGISAARGEPAGEGATTTAGRTV